ncbi:LipA and NB-ARC domain protein [Diplocarpon rosae]|nr:LipA and NB-ARC domain protein [Diplocarpon rosae]
MDFSEPPPYREIDSQTSTQFRIARKPVCADRPKTAASGNQNTPPTYIKELEKLKQSRLQALPPTQLLPRRDLSPTTTVQENLIDPHVYKSPSRTEPSSDGVPSKNIYALSTTHSSSNASLKSSTTAPQSSTGSYVQQAFREARHFAGGLVTHPTESTNHFTILRHSHGLVYYQGAETSLAISIFADQPLPPSRTIWLQNKGWSGKTGMRARAFVRRNGNWINVTPSLGVDTEQLKPSDERAWQRDIAHFRKKTKTSKLQCHVLRETAIVRIPEEAEDGYFQFVLCLGDKQKVLCPSPVFRIISASASPGSLRGASLTTLPLEVGAIALGIYARNTAGRIVGPAAAVVQNRVQKLMPSWVTQQAGAAASGLMKPSDSLASPEVDGENLNRDGLAWPASRGDAILDFGPQAPYPLRFMANSELAVVGIEQFNLPGMALTGVPANLAMSLSGYYLGWARLTKQPTTRSSKTEDDTWCPGIISALPRYTPPDITNIIIRLIRNFDDIPSNRQVIEVRIMGLIRPDHTPQRDALQKGLQVGDAEAAEAAMLVEMNDILLAENILDRPAWNPDAVPWASVQPGTSSGQSMKMAAQRQIGKVPFHRFGVRLPAEGSRDTLVAAGGYFVTR